MESKLIIVSIIFQHSGSITTTFVLQTRIIHDKLLHYGTAHLSESQFEPGSRGRVLKNKKGITSAREILGE
jgi:hypothetical protein